MVVKVCGFDIHSSFNKLDSLGSNTVLETCTDRNAVSCLTQQSLIGVFIFAAPDILET